MNAGSNKVIYGLQDSKKIFSFNKSHYILRI